MAELVATGAIEVPIAATFPLDQVADAFEQLEKRHTRGKIVLILTSGGVGTGRHGLDRAG
jgi:NADPH2:quinone reductase